MNLLVTGGAGFVGLHVLKALAGRGHRVVSLSVEPRLESSGLAWLGEDAGRVVALGGDVTDLDVVRTVLREHRVESIVHAAAVTAIGDMERQAVLPVVRVNVGGTATVLEAARIESVKRLTYVSSATVYGSGHPARSIPETEPARPDDVYGITKHAAERLVLRHGVLFGLDVTILRLSSPYGPLERVTGARQLMSPTYHWCRSAIAGEPVGLGPDLERDFTYVGDVGEAIARVATTGGLPERTYNLAAGRNYRYSEVLEAIRRQSPGLVVRRSGETTDEFFRATQRGPLDIARAHRDLDFEPIGVDEGLRRYLHWLATNPI